MKIALRLVVLAIIALALSFSMVSADEEESLGAFIQAATTYEISYDNPGTALLTVTGVAGVTPILVGNTVAGNYATADFIADWLASETFVNGTLRFQLGNPLVADEDGVFIYDFSVDVSILPVEIWEDGTIVYEIALVDVYSLDFTGTSLSDIEVLETERPVDVLNRYWDGDVFSGEFMTIVIPVNAEFASALTAARIARLEGARPSGVGGSCIPGVSCP